MQTQVLEVTLKSPHPKQADFINSPAKRKVVRAGRRSGKTTGVAMMAVDKFLDGHRVLYAAPTSEQTDKFWFEVTTALDAPIKYRVYHINQTQRFIDLQGTEQRIKAKTAWNADTLRGDYADILILEEYQMMDPTAWDDVGAPMLLDNNGDAIFIYTPPRPGAKNQEKGPHARLMFKKAEQDTTGRWAAFHFTSHDNPHLSRAALDDIVHDMSPLAYRREIMAEDLDANPDALWSREVIENTRLKEAPDLGYVVVSVDPPAKQGKCGIIVGGRRQMDDGQMHAFVTADHSLRGKPGVWGRRVVTVYDLHKADRVIGEVNNGGDMVESTVKVAAGQRILPFKQIRASRGKMLRAEPVAALFREGRVHLVGEYETMEDQMCLAGDTLIATSHGQRPICEVCKGDLVWTRYGLKPVLWAGMTSPDAKVCQIEIDGFHNLVATVHHPVYNMKDGFVPMNELNIGDEIGVVTWTNLRQLADLVSMVNKLSGWDYVGAEREMAITVMEGGHYYIEPFGKSPMDPSQMECSSTIKMKTGGTATSPTLNLSPVNDMQNYTQSSIQIQEHWKSAGKNADIFGQIGKEKSLSVLNVVRPLAHGVCELSIVLGSVDGVCITDKKELDTRQPVYNLTVADEHEFFANDILVHNCNWVPGMDSPDELDAMVHLVTELLLLGRGWVRGAA